MLIGYARVSTQDQTVILQKDALEKIGCSKIFTDVISGATMERKGLDATLKYVREGDTLVVWRLDRSGRSHKHLIETITTLNNRKIGFKSITENIDTTTSGGKLIFHIFGALAEFERDIIRERTQAGLQAARARGRTGGWPKATTLNNPKRWLGLKHSMKIKTILLMRFVKPSTFQEQHNIAILRSNNWLLQVIDPIVLFVYTC
jgi:DNA invertase Pin-like site-specific DNA recombinase